MPHRKPAEHWRRQAQEARQLAAMMSLISDQLILLKMAEHYEGLANAAEERQRKQSRDC